MLDELEAVPESPARSKVFAAYAAEQNNLLCGRFYEAMSDPDVCGFVSSSRRHYLLDAIAQACVIYRRLALSGPILDVGCHVGIAPDIMSRLLGVSCVGLEPVGSAMRAGTSRLADTPDVELVHGALPWHTERRFEFVTAIDSMPRDISERSLFLKAIADLLSDGGIAMIVSENWVDPDVSVLRRQLKAAHLGYCFGDRVGSYGGMPNDFTVEGCVCLIKNGNQRFPRAIKAEINRDWKSFQDYVHTSSTPKRAKTQAFQRAIALDAASGRTQGAGRIG